MAQRHSGSPGHSDVCPDRSGHVTCFNPTSGSKTDSAMRLESVAPCKINSDAAAAAAHALNSSLASF